MDASELAKTIGEALTSYMKAGPLSDDQAEHASDAVTDSLASSIVSVSEAVAQYRQRCDELAAATTSAQGLPLRSIVSVEALRNADKSPTPDRLGAMRDKIQDRHRFCIENFQKQAEKCFDEELITFRKAVFEFLQCVPAQRTKDKTAKAMLADIKKMVKSLAKWDRLFYTYKAMSFPEELDFLFAYQGSPIAAEWHFSALDYDCDYQMDHDHQALNGTIYLVRNSWAMEKGYIDLDSAPYIEEVVRPKQDVGCMCSLTWLFNLRDLPAHLLSKTGQNALERTRVQ